MEIYNKPKIFYSPDVWSGSSPASIPARRAVSTEWKLGLPEADDFSYVGEVKSYLKRLAGIPQSPVATISITAGYGSEMRRFENRTPVFNGGLRIISYRSPAEEAIDNVLRPNNNVIEVGPYRNGKFDLVERIYNNDGELRYNGQYLPHTDKVDAIKRVVKNLKLKRVQFHMNSDELVALGEKLGLSSRERLDVYKKLGQKSSFNDALDVYSQKHKDATIGKFGISFQSISESVEEVKRLRNFGVGACIKFDEFEEGQNLTGGKGQMLIKQNTPNAQIQRTIESFVRSHGGSNKIGGVVQMFVENNRVYSVSTGEKGRGNYQIYEGHIQTQEGFAADGAKPIGKNIYGKELFAAIMPQVFELYKENGICGDQNLNLLVLSPKDLKLARIIYNNPRLSPIVPIDLNPRPLSGTKVAMGRFQEETGSKINFENFFTRGVNVDPFYAANPHLIYWHARKMGLNAGKGGNFSMTNLGRFVSKDLVPGRLVSSQLYAQNVSNPEESLKQIEICLSKSPTSGILEEICKEGLSYLDFDYTKKLKHSEYVSFLVENLKKIIN